MSLAFHLTWLPYRVILTTPLATSNIRYMSCWPNYLLWLIIAILGTSHMLTACGQKGPLYLPEPERTEESAKPPQ